MTRRLAITVALAALFALPAAAARPVEGVRIHGGVYTAHYEVADGADARVVPVAEYLALVHSGACTARSHVSVWERERAVSFVCET